MLAMSMRSPRAEGKQEHGSCELSLPRWRVLREPCARRRDVALLLDQRWGAPGGGAAGAAEAGPSTGEGRSRGGHPGAQSADDGTTPRDSSLSSSHHGESGDEPEFDAEEHSARRATALLPRRLGPLTATMPMACRIRTPAPVDPKRTTFPSEVTTPVAQPVHRKR